MNKKKEIQSYKLNYNPLYIKSTKETLVSKNSKIFSILGFYLDFFSLNALFCLGFQKNR